MQPLAEWVTINAFVVTDMARSAWPRNIMRGKSVLELPDALIILLSTLRFGWVGGIRHNTFVAQQYMQLRIA